MANKLEMKVRNLELLLHIKSLILKADNVNMLLSQVCKKITKLEVYDISWAILTNQNNTLLQGFSSEGSLAGKFEQLCWKDALNTSELFTLPRDSARCKLCILSKQHESTLLSKRLEFEGVIFGVFSVSVKNCLLDHGVEGQFSDLVLDISRAISAIKLKEKKARYENELIESRHMYKKLLETSSLPVGIMDLEFNITYMSNSLKELFGFDIDKERAKGKFIKGLDFLTKDFKEKAESAIHEMLEDDVVNFEDVVFNTKRGEQKKMRLRISVMKNAAGKSNGYMVVFHDLSSELKTAEALKMSEEQFRLLFMKAPNGVSLLSPGGVILDCNEHDAEMLKMKRSELIGTHIKQYLTGEYQEVFERNFKEFVKAGFKDIVVQLTRKDGGVISVSRSVSAIHNLGGALTGIIVHSRDVTEDIKAQDQINLLLSAIEQSSSVFTITDLEGNITYVNKKFTELTGYSFDEVKGENPRFLKSGLLSDIVYKDLWEKLKNGEIWKGELCNKRKNGDLYWEYASMTAIRNSKGELTNFLKVAEDITQRRKADQNLKETTVRYHNIFNLVPNPIIIHIDGIIVDSNQAAFQFSKSENMKDLLGRNVMEFVHDSSKEKIKRRIEKLRNKGGNVPVTEAVFLNLLGEERSVKTVSNRVSFKGEDAYMAVFEDITDYKEAEQKVLDSEKKFRDIFNLNPDPVSIADLESGVLHEANDALVKFLGTTRDKIIGVSSYDIGLYDRPETRRNLVKHIKKKGFIDNYEVDFQVSGGVVTALVSATMFGDEDRNQVLFVARDVTKIKKAEQELKELNVRYRNIFNMAPNPIIIHVNGSIVDINRAALLFAGAKSREELLGANIMGFIHDSSRKEILNQIRVLNRGGKILPFDAAFLNLKGEKRDVRTASNIISFGGEQAYMVFFEDITERKRAVQKLIESEKRFRMFFNLIPIPVIITNIKRGTFIEFNDAALKLTGGAYNDFINKDIIEYGLFKDSGVREILLNKLANDGALLNEELELRINNKIYTMLVSASFIAPAEEQNVLWVAHDITERKEMEQDLIKARNRAEANEKLKSSFLSNISHEIRTPMNAILGFSDLLRDAEIETEARNNYINIIQQRGKDLLKMINDIMDISKIESGSLDLQNRAVRIRSVVHEVIANSKEMLERMPSKNIIIESKCEIDDNQLVNGDKYRIRQVISNLVENAIKFTFSGIISIRCWNKDDKIIFEIEDTGCGIAPDKINQAFERFVQVHEIKDVSIGGSGLGLSISKSLLNLMGGEIWIESELNKGTKLGFSLKAYSGGDVVLPSSGANKELAWDWSDKTILIAEDEPSNQMFIKVILNKTKVNIIMANDGREAIELFNTNKEQIDLVIMDVKMPELNGYEVTQYIKDICPETPVIALTANAMNNDREEAFKSGCDDYLAKPIAKELLYTTIEKYI